MHNWKHVAMAVILMAALAAGPWSGCGRLIDKDTIRVAKMDDEYITRGDLYKLISGMGNKDRPKIRNKGDLLKVLNDFIDRQIKIPVGKQLAQEGKIDVPRDRAREHFFSQSGDDEQQYRAMWKMEIPPDGQTTPLMEVYNLSGGSLRAMQSIIEQGTDRAQRELQAEEALLYLAVKSFQAGELEADPAALELEYQLNKDKFKKLEWLKFLGVRFPAAAPDALAQAAEVRKKNDAGEDFEAILAEYAGKKDSAVIRPAVAAATVIESEIENNPELPRFRGFWAEASGAKVGAIIGPVYLPQYQQVAQDNQGRQRTVNMPDAYIVLKVLERTGESEMSLEEAKPMLLPAVLVAQKMKQLRAQHGVEIYEDKLPDPGRYQDTGNMPF